MDDFCWAKTFDQLCDGFDIAFTDQKISRGNVYKSNTVLAFGSKMRGGKIIIGPSIQQCILNGNPWCYDIRYAAINNFLFFGWLLELFANRYTVACAYNFG